MRTCIHGYCYRLNAATMCVYVHTHTYIYVDVGRDSYAVIYSDICVHYICSYTL